jgi:deazaflavin-dependent oxidoreductase (nitroreductase family)
MGNKFLLLNHLGRKSGKRRQTVLEILQIKPETAEYFVVSGFGKQSDWYQNIQSNPSVIIQVGGRKMAAVARQLNPDQASQVILSYAQRYPKNLKTLSALLGYEIEHSQAGYLAFGREIPVICFCTSAQQH